MDSVDIVETGKVDYTSYYGDITIKRKGGSLKFTNAKNFDEEYALKEKQKLADGDRICTGRKSFITIVGQPQDGKLQLISIFPESELAIRTHDWQAPIKGRMHRGQDISRLELVKGSFYMLPAGAELEIPLVKIKSIDKKMDFKLMVDIVPGMTVILPGCKMEVSSSGKTYETHPAYGMLGMTELMVTGSGMYERSMEVDERASMLSSTALQFAMGLPADFKYDESTMDYTARKLAENKKKQAEAAKQMATPEELDKMKGKKGISDAQLEMAKATSKAWKAAGDPTSPAFAMNMMANMDLSKLKDMPGLTPEQRKQIEAGIPMMEKMKKELSGGKLEQLTAQTNLSAKYLETAANDPVAKKKMAQYKAELKERLDSFSLPPYPKPDEKFRVK